MLNKILKEVVTLIVGKQAEDIVDLLDAKKHINEFIIAKKLDLTINQTRNILYKISDYGLVSYIRKKDKKKGWFTYFWKLETVKVFELLINIKKKNIDQIEHQIKSRETKSFYVCQKCNIEFTEENAMFHDFSCIECGQLLTMVDSSKILKDLRKNLNNFNEEVKIIDEQILKEKEKFAKVKIRQEKKLVKKKPVKKKTMKKTKKTPVKKTLKKIKSVNKKVKKTKKTSVRKKSLKKIKNIKKPKLKKFSPKTKKLSKKKK